jgi:predicted acyltransferase
MLPSMPEDNPVKTDTGAPPKEPTAVGQEGSSGPEQKAERGVRISSRLTSLDAFRGATIAAMILVNNPGSWSHVYAPLRHAQWHGWTPTDLIFPFFLFIIGVAMPISFGKRLARGDSKLELVKHVIRRSLIIFGLGLFMAAFPKVWANWDTLRIMGVLPRIAVVYLFASLLYLALDRRGRWVAVAALLLLYWALMTLVYVPGVGPANLTPEGNLGAYLDRLILGQQHLWRGDPWDPEGLLSTLPAIVTTLLAIFIGEWLLSDRLQKQKVVGLLVAGLIGVVIGTLWGKVFPINKSLWTSSYVVFTAGMASLLLAIFYWAIDVRGWTAWSKPFVVYGMNAIAVFVLSGLLTRTLGRWRVPAGDGTTTSMYNWIYTHVFASWAGPLNGSLAFAISYILFWLVLMWILYRRRIFIKI